MDFYRAQLLWISVDSIYMICFQNIKTLVYIFFVKLKLGIFGFENYSSHGVSYKMFRVKGYWMVISFINIYGSGGYKWITIAVYWKRWEFEDEKRMVFNLKYSDLYGI